MPEPDALVPEAGAATRRFLTFRMDRRLYAAPAEDVAEVIRSPAVARVPQGPRSLLGIANLRGGVLPVASLRGLLGQAEGPATSASRAIVLQGGAPVALAVDSVGSLVSAAPEEIETRRAALAEAPGERLLGIFQPREGGEPARILDVRGLLDAAFVQRPRPPRRNAPGVALQQAEGGAADARQKLVTFEVAGQEFGLDLAAVHEIVPTPAAVAVTPGAEAVVVGVMAYRDGLLPLMSLRGLLGFARDAAAEARSKVVVAVVNGALVGLIADRMRAIVPADPDLMEATPPMLAARTGGETRIKAIYRGEGGRRLISVLAPEQLFREDVMQRLGAGQQPSHATSEDVGAAVPELRFLVFRLGDDAFALPIDAVDEVARAPEQITRLPKTPPFLEGVVNLRGEVLPVVDQRRRFGMPEGGHLEGRRLIVVRTERHRAGLIVDSVSEVLRTPADAIEPAPDLAGEATRLVSGVLNLPDSGRIVLLLDPAELLTRAEQGLLDGLAAEGEQALP